MMLLDHLPTRRIGTAAVAGALLLASCGDNTADVPAAEADVSDTADSGTVVGSDLDTPDATDSAAESTGTDSDEAASGTGSSVPGDPTTGKPSIQLPVEVPEQLVVTELVAGAGDPAEAGDTIELHYVGVLSKDGTEFDNSYSRGEPIQFQLGTPGLIEGFNQGLVGAREGARIQLDIPSNLAYGEAGRGDLIQPGAALTFVVDVTAVIKPVPVTIPAMADPNDCPATDGSEPKQQEFDEYPPFCIDVTKTYTAEITTNFGEISIELDPQRAPLTVNSFVTLAWFHYFDNTECHRAIPGFVVQCGDPTATGTGGPGYRFSDELPQQGEYQIGSIAMANSGPDTNGSQFFIITGPQGAALPPQYSLFAEVTAGETVVAEMDGVANPDNNGVPPLDQIIIESVTITTS